MIGMVAGWARVAGCCLLLGLLALVSAANAQQPVPVPALQARVTDLAGLLQPAQVSGLEQQLSALEAEKGAQLALLIVPTTGAETIEQYALRVAETWQLGRGQVEGKAVDDGVLLLVAARDRKIRIEVGYGLEGAIPDAYAKRIIDGQITPAFRNGDYAGGLTAAVASLSALIRGEPLPAPVKKRSAARGDDGSNYVVPIFFGFVVGTIAMAIVGKFFGTTIGVAASVIVALMTALALFDVIFSAVGTFVVLSVFGGGRMNRVGRHTYRSGTPVFLPGGFGGRGGGGGFGGGGASGGW